jgi:hypothetical protein
MYTRCLKLLVVLLAPFGLIHVCRAWLRYRIGLRERYRPRPDDIFIVTYQKSGTTLMQMLLYQLTTSGEMDIPHILSVSPWFEADLMNGGGPVDFFESLPSPRFFKSHLPYGKLPRNGRFIYIARDVRDVAVSAFHHQRLATGRDHDLGRFVDRFLRDQMNLPSWYKHLESWWPHRDDENVLFLTYEQVLGDLPGTVRKVAEFCRIELDEKELPRIVERCGIDFMKRYKETFDPRLRRYTTKPVEFVRKGIAGAGREELTASQEETVSRRLQELAARLSCSPDERFSELFR